jgi:hypothetical protein
MLSMRQPRSGDEAPIKGPPVAETSAILIPVWDSATRHCRVTDGPEAPICGLQDQELDGALPIFKGLVSSGKQG